MVLGLQGRQPKTFQIAQVLFRPGRAVLLEADGIADWQDKALESQLVAVNSQPRPSALGRFLPVKTYLGAGYIRCEWLVTSDENG